MTFGPNKGGHMLRSRARGRVALCVVGAWLALPGAARADVIADSLDEFSMTGTQGENGWFNGYYNFTADGDGLYSAGEFIEFTNSCGNGGSPCPDGGPIDPAGNHWATNRTWDLHTGGPWTMVGPENGHPNGANSAPNEEHWAIRRWVSDHDGEVAIH